MTLPPQYDSNHQTSCMEIGGGKLTRFLTALELRTLYLYLQKVPGALCCTVAQGCEPVNRLLSPEGKRLLPMENDLGQFYLFRPGSVELRACGHL